MENKTRSITRAARSVIEPVPSARFILRLSNCSIAGLPGGVWLLCMDDVVGALSWAGGKKEFPATGTGFFTKSHKIKYRILRIWHLLYNKYFEKRKLLLKDLVHY
jgi:hypothetical protein